MPIGTLGNMTRWLFGRRDGRNTVCGDRPPDYDGCNGVGLEDMPETLYAQLTYYRAEPIPNPPTTVVVEIELHRYETPLPEKCVTPDGTAICDCGYPRHSRTIVYLSEPFFFAEDPAPSGNLCSCCASMSVGATYNTETSVCNWGFGFNQSVTEGSSNTVGLDLGESYEFTHEFLTIDTAAIAIYRRATNSDTYLGWPPGTGRLIGFSARNSFLYGAPNERWDVTARVQFREPYANTTPAQAWHKRWRHEGLYINDNGVIRRATDDQMQEVTKRVLLKEDGTQETNPDAAVFFHTQVYGSLPYAALGLI